MPKPLHHRPWIIGLIVVAFAAGFTILGLWIYAINYDWPPL
ncbi:MAG: hypothetical protein WEB06_19570 [Actinomycetota bacterium]